MDIKSGDELKVSELFTSILKHLTRVPRFDKKNNIYHGIFHTLIDLSTACLERQFHLMYREKSSFP